MDCPISDKGLDSHPFIFLPTALLDLMAANFISIGEVLTRDPATKGILKSSTMIWCYLLSIPLFKREARGADWCGIMLIFFGGFVKVSIIVPGLFPNYKIQDHCQLANSTISSTLPNTPTSSNLTLGYAMFMIGCLFQSCLFVYQEWLMKNYSISPLRLASWEGILSLLLQGLILIPLYHIKWISKLKILFIPLNTLILLTNNCRCWNQTREQIRGLLWCIFANSKQQLGIFLDLWADSIHAMLYTFCFDCLQVNVCCIFDSFKQPEAIDCLGYISHSLGPLPLQGSGSISLHSSHQFSYSHQWCVDVQRLALMVND